MNLQSAQAWLLSTLADSHDIGHWSDSLLSEALRQALVLYSSAGNAREVSFTVVTTGHEQDLSSLAPFRIQEVAWPWEEGQRFADLRRTDWRMVGEATVRFDLWEIAAGEILRVRYLPRHQLSGLDGAEETTLWANEYDAFIHGAANRAFLLRLHAERQLQGSDVMGLREAAHRELDAFYAARGSGAEMIYWGGMGL